MTAYRKHLLAWACIVAVELTIGTLGLYISKWFLVPFLALIYAIPFVLKGITCPNCGESVTYQGAVFGRPVRGGFIRRTCQKCGWDLNQAGNA
jgi:hypothetical protein